MGDFHQHGLITTLHQLNSRPLEKLEADLMQFRKHRPMALVLPSLYSELQMPALSSILKEIEEVPYLDQIVVGLDRANEAEYRHALEFFGALPQQPQVLWNDGPRLRKIDALLAEKGLAPRKAAYYRIALDLVDSYHSDALINGLKYDRHTEGSAVEVFAENILSAGEEFLDPSKSMDVPFMPSWKRVIAAVPDILHQLREAVEEDRYEYGSEIVINPALHPKAQRIRGRVGLHVREIYGDEDAEEITEELMEAAGMSELEPYGCAWITNQ